MDYYLLGKLPATESAKENKKLTGNTATTSPVPEEELHD
jgi:hypothetical protein